MGDFLSHSSARRDWILKRGSPHCSFNDHRSFSRLRLFCIDAILIGIWWNRDSFWMIQGVIFKCSKRNSEWYIFFGEKKRRIEWKSKEIFIESSRFSVNQRGKWMIDTHDSIPLRSFEIRATRRSNSRRIEWERIVHYAKRWKRWRFRKRMEQEGRKGDTCGLEVGIARFRSETETGIGGMPLE